jgi:hypothetical protein
MPGKPLKAGDPCSICGTEMVAITRETYNQIVETLHPTIYSIPRAALKRTAPLLPICPRCDAYALGAEMVEGFPFLDKNGKIGRIDSIW